MGTGHVSRQDAGLGRKEQGGEETQRQEERDRREKEEEGELAQKTTGQPEEKSSRLIPRFELVEV
jgi:hypothetical protein